MPAMNIILDGDNAWPDLREKVADGTLPETEAVSVACLPRGMNSGKPTVAIRLDLPDGTAVIGQTSLALFLTAADAFKARYGDPRHD